MNKETLLKVICLIMAVIVFLMILSTVGNARDYVIEDEVCPYRLLILTPEDELLLAQCLEAETGGSYSPYECRIATCQVILNRILDGRWGNIDGVIRSPSQFTTYPFLLGVEPSEETYEAMYNTLMGVDLQFGYDVCYFSVATVPGTEFVCRIGNHSFSR